MPSHSATPSPLPPEPAANRSRHKSAATRQRTKGGGARPRKPRRAELEASLHACEERFRTTVDDLSDLVCRSGPDGNLSFVNGAFCQFFGKSRQELIGTSWRSQVAAGELPRMTTALQTLSLQNPVVVCDCQVEAAHGLERRLRFVHRAFFDATGQFVDMQTVGHDVTGREASDKQREDLVRHRQIALDAARLGGWHYDPRSGMASWDGRCQEIFGIWGPDRPAAEILAQVHPDDRPHVQAAMDAALRPADPSPFAAEYRVMRPDGNQRWVEAHGLAEFEGVGNTRHAVSFAGTVQDITERKQAEADLRRWADAFEHCAYGVALGQPEVNQLLACNPAYARMLGRTMADLVGRPILDLYAPEERERVRGNLSAADRTGQSRLETHMIRADGTTFPVQLDLVSVRDGTGQLPRYRVATVQDITQRRQTEAVIREQSLLQDQLAKITATVPGIIYSFRMRPDGSACVPFATPMIEDLWGLRPEEIRVDFAEGFARIHADDSSRVHESILESARSLTPWRDVFRVLHPQSGERWVEGHSVPRREEDGSILWHGFMHDVTERKRIEEERELMVRLLRLFNQASDLRELLREVTGLLHEWFGFEAVGVRLRDGEDFPYFETHGFAAEFVQLENRLCQRNADGQLVRGRDGQPVLECMCGNVLCRRFDPAQTFFTERGSFWANDTTRLLATTTPADRQAYTRNRCNGEGYESVALFALRVGETTYGLLQVNDHRKNRFTTDGIALLERVADSLAVAIAHRQSAQQLGESEQQFRVMFEVASIGMAQADVRTGRWLRVNPKLCEITGYSEAEMLRMGVPDITHPDDRDKDWDLFQQVVRGEAPDYRTEKRYLRKGGQVAWVNVNMTVIRDAAGQPVRTMATIEDITDRKRAEAALRESEAGYRALFDSSRDAIVTLEPPHWQFTSANAATLSMFRATSGAQFAALGPREISPPLQPDGRCSAGKAQEMIETAQHEGSYLFEWRHRRLDGTEFPADVLLTRMERAGKTILQATVRDITARKRAEQALADEAARRRILVDQSSDGIVVIDEQGAVCEANRRYAEMLGYTPEEVLRLHVWDWDNQWDRAQLLQMIQDVGETGSRFETRHRRKDGSLFDVEISNNGATIAGRKLVFCVCRDISQRKRAEEQLRKLSRAVEQSPASIVITDLQGRIEYVNPKFVAITGYSFEEARGQNPRVLKSGELPAAVYAELWSTITAGGEWRGEFHNRRKDGSFFWESAVISAVKDDAGKVTHFLAVKEDITARKHAEQALRKSEALLREMGRLSKAGGWELDVVTGDGQWTEEIARIHDLDLDTQPTRELSTAFYQGKSRAQLEAAVENAIAHGMPYDLELEFVSAKGNRKWVHTIGQPLSRGGQVVKLRGTLQDITERKQAEAALRTSQELYHSLVEQLGHPLFRLDRDGRLTFANSRYCKAMNRPLEELVGKSDFDLFPADLAATYWADSRQVMDSGQPFESLERHPGPGGRDSYVRVAKTPLHNAAGQIVGLQCLFWDVTSQHLAERALRESEQRFLAAFQSSPAPAVITSAATQQIREVNAAFCTLTGFSRAELLGETCLGRGLWASPVERAEMMRRYEADGRVRGLEIALRTRAGEVRTLLYSVESLHLDGEPCWIASGVDITERKQAEAALRQMNQELEQRVAARTKELAQSERRHRDLVETIPDWVWEVDAQGRCIFCGPQCRDLLGFEPDEILGQTPFVFMPPDEAMRVAPLTESLMAQGKTLRALENVNRRKDGSLVVLETHGVPVYDDAGCLLGYRGVNRDITERRQAAEDLRQAKDKADAANRAKSVFLANMSHEIRTPMNAVLGFAQLLLSDATTTPDQRQSLARIMRSGEHLLDIINEILEMARIESGRSVLNPVPFDLPNLLRDLDAMFTLRAQSQRIAFAIEQAEDLPRTLAGDATKLRQILINLLSNAFKFTAAEGRITLRLKSKPDAAGQVRLTAEVEDTGIGLQPAEAACVFEPFFQTASGRAAGGTGLGLSISREIALLMGGDLTVHSEAGVGSRFELTVVLPIAGTARYPDGSPHSEVLRLKDGFHGYRVLVVDDSQDNSEVLARLLTPLNFQVQVASNGLEALALSRSWAPGLIILDLRMPVMDGFEACRRIRSQGGPAPKILILSASVSSESHQQALATGADDFMRKPFQLAELLERIRSLTGVDYVRTAPPPPSPLPLAGNLDWLAHESVSTIPAEWLLKARKALVAADYYELLDLASQVAASDDSLGQRLRALVEQLDYATLDKLLNPPGSSPLA